MFCPEAAAHTKECQNFVLCAIKFDNCVHLRSDNKKKKKDGTGSLGSLFVRIEDTVGRMGQHLGQDKSPPFGLYAPSLMFEMDIQSLKDEIDEWYATMSDCTRKSGFLPADEVDMSDSVLENLEDFLSFRVTSQSKF